jgi:hypothetical protein
MAQDNVLRLVFVMRVVTFWALWKSAKFFTTSGNASLSKHDFRDREEASNLPIHCFTNARFCINTRVYYTYIPREHYFIYNQPLPESDNEELQILFI